jgi:hypothetical protein
MYLYQQELRGRLLAKAGAERTRRPWWCACAVTLVALVRWTFMRPDPVRIAQPAAS